MDAGLMGKRVAANDCLIPLHLHPGDVGEQSAGRHEAGRVDPRRGMVVVGAGAHRHDHLFERAVAGPLADAIDRTLDLPGPVFDGGQTVGDRQAEVVVTVDADHRLVDVRHTV